MVVLIAVYAQNEFEHGWILDKIESKADRTMQHRLPGARTFELLHSCSDLSDQRRVVVDFVALWGFMEGATHIC